MWVMHYLLVVNDERTLDIELDEELGVGDEFQSDGCWWQVSAPREDLAAELGVRVIGVVGALPRYFSFGSKLAKVDLYRPHLEAIKRGARQRADPSLATRALTAAIDAVLAGEERAQLSDETARELQAVLQELAVEGSLSPQLEALRIEAHRYIGDPPRPRK